MNASRSDNSSFMPRGVSTSEGRSSPAVALLPKMLPKSAFLASLVLLVAPFSATAAVLFFLKTES
jgi:hypothetical protein